MIIAVDGPAAAGKGTLARRIADHFGYAYLDTGLLYRAVAEAVLSQGGDPGDATAAAEAAATIDLERLDRPDLRTDEIGAAASVVAAHAEVRAALVDLQRRFAAEPPGGEVGAVLDGRDIGTVICPDADAKIFVTADIEARADRRHKELRQRGRDSIYARVLQEMKERDGRDSGRPTAPLRVAEDAFVLDTTNLDAETAFDAALAFLKSRTARRGG